MRTSRSHPLRIEGLATPLGGVIGLTFCPGKVDPNAMTGAWDRDLQSDLQAIRTWGARAVVTLMEEHELTLLRVPTLGEATAALGMKWLHLPFPDGSIPGAEFERVWPDASSTLHQILRTGERIVIHCRGGLGRTGVVAVRLLVEMGEYPGVAIRQVRAARRGAVETVEQERYLLALT